MTKRRFLSLTAAGIFILYCACTIVTFTSSEKYAEKEFDNFIARVDESYNIFEEMYFEDIYAETGENYGRTPTGIIANFSYAAQSERMNHYPFYACIYYQNKLIAQTGSFISFYDEEAGSERIVNIEEYMTSEIKKEISSFLKSLKDFPYPIYKEFSYAVIDGNIYPVSFTICDCLNSEDAKELTVKLNSYPASHTVAADEDSTSISGYLYDIDKDSFRHRAYQKLEMLADTLISNPGEHYEALQAEKATCGETSIEINGERYRVYTSAYFNPFMETLSSEFFKTQILNQTILFIIAGAAILFAANKIYNNKIKAEKSKAAFTNAAAHELKTPLSVIQNQCECIMENIAPEKNPEYINSIYSESQRMNKLVASLLQYNRLSAADNIDKTRCRLDELIHSEINKYSSFISSKKIVLETNIVSNAEINCRSDLIALVIDNFLSNAVKHTESENKIIINLVKENGGLRFSVFNEGNSIALKDKDALWDVFYKEDTSRNSADDSTGMGLAICKQILELHSFKYGYENKENGVEFYFTAK